MRLRCSGRSGAFGGSELVLFSEAAKRRSGAIESPSLVLVDPSAGVMRAMFSLAVRSSAGCSSKRMVGYRQRYIASALTSRRRGGGQGIGLYGLSLLVRDGIACPLYSVAYALLNAWR